MVRYYVIFQGRVQGVGFRFLVQSTASKYSLTGWVRNMDNGCVELEVQGEEVNVNKFICILREGNRFIRIDDFSMKNRPLIDDEKRFRVTY